MAESAPVTARPGGLETGTYEILRQRLATHAESLSERLEILNAKRRDVFGAIEFTLLGTERITTPNNCVPRDMVPLGGNRFLFGYNVRMGLKTETKLEDVFSIYSYRGRMFHEEPLDPLKSGDFESDFKELYKYYRESTFSAFRVIGPFLYMAFQVGKSLSDLKVFKWAIDERGIQYLDNRSDHEFKYPPQHEFEWKRAVRDYHRAGRFPHVSIEDRVFVECLGGDLTVKIEDNTESGEGIYSEPVENRDQTLDDAEIYYAILDALVILKIRPFQEKQFRYLVYSEKVKEVRRIDDIEKACVLLPDGHGIIFAHGYYLQTGEYKIFENEFTDMVYAARVDAPNGEDYLYDFLNRETGVDILLAYNRIEQKVKTPIICNGFSVFENGEMILFRSPVEPQKHHALQVWRTPFLGSNVVTEAKTDSFLFKVGNSAVVNAMSECFEVLTLCRKEDTYGGLYLDLVRKTSTILDTYFWLGEGEIGDLSAPLAGIRDAAAAAIEEFEKVSRLKRNAREALNALEAKLKDRAGAIDYHNLPSIDVFVGHLSGLRALRGEIVSARDVRYIDAARLQAMETQVIEHADRLSQLCVKFLLEPAALKPYADRAESFRGGVAGIAKVVDATRAEEEIGKAAGELEMLIEIVGGLKIEDATESTRIIDSISTIYATLNQVKSLVRGRRRDLSSVEGAAQFGAQLKLLGQAVTNFIDLCDTTQKCDEYLTKLMVQVEELEGRFADFDEFVTQLGAKREEIYSAFSTRKVQLAEARQKRANALAETADRILAGIRNRAMSFKSLDELNAWFASDLMVEKARDTAAKLTEIEDTVRADEVLGRLKTIQQDAVRQIKDKLELYTEGENVIRFGPHSFSVNTQPLDCTLVLKDGAMHVHLTGTNYFERVEDPEFLATREVWDQEIVSENRAVYRAEYLAYEMLREAAARGDDAIEALRALSAEERQAKVKEAAAPRYAEGYVKGVHDVDAARILRELLRFHAELRLLRFSPGARAAARLWWEDPSEAEEKALMAARLKSLGAARRLFPAWDDRSEVGDLQARLLAFARSGWFDEEHAGEAAEYLFELLCAGGAKFPVSPEVAAFLSDFQENLRGKGALKDFEAAREAVRADRRTELAVVRGWLAAFRTGEGSRHDAALVEKAAVVLLGRGATVTTEAAHSLSVTVDGLIGTHARITGGRMEIHYHEFMKRLARFAGVEKPAFERYTAMKKELLERRRTELRLAEYMPKVLTTFVRNQLIDKFYLPLVGANMAKQLGVVGAAKRTDRMGLLLLVSPPGYGKTTLMEYIANRLGIVFMKVNGPALGERVLSLDPEEAPNASAREEVNKLNLALEMGDNVMICVDDIQHTNPEFLQKFISLCDAQRRIEGVWRGTPRTYDLRGRKVMVVMAGNPYTESGEKFRIPDMLANRADTYNLGDVVSNNEEMFRDSYLENSITSNPILARLARSSQKDVQGVIRLARSGRGESVELEGNYSPEELNEMTEVMKRLLKVRETVYRVNQEYIRSAAMAEAYRTEPPFKLQGSYRNMNRLAEKVLPIMTESEIDDLLYDHYKNEAQTLTTGSEANLLKFKEMAGKLSQKDAERWDEIKKAYKRHLVMGQGDPADPVGRVVAQLSSFREGIDALQSTITKAFSTAVATAAEMVKKPEAETVRTETSLAPETLAALKALAADLRFTASPATAATAPQVNVEAPQVSVEPQITMPEPQVFVMPTPAAAPAPAGSSGAAPTANQLAASSVADQTPYPAVSADGSPQFEGEYSDVFELPLGETVSFAPRVYTLNGAGFRPGSHFFIYDKVRPVVIRDGSTITHVPPADPKNRPCVERGEVALSFEITSENQARLTFQWLNVTNRGLEVPHTEILPFTIVNPDGKFAPYSSMHLKIQPVVGPGGVPKVPPAAPAGRPRSRHPR